MTINGWKSDDAYSFMYEQTSSAVECDVFFLYFLFLLLANFGPPQWTYLTFMQQYLRFLGTACHLGSGDELMKKKCWGDNSSKHLAARTSLSQPRWFPVCCHNTALGIPTYLCNAIIFIMLPFSWDEIQWYWLIKFMKKLDNINFKHLTQKNAFISPNNNNIIRFFKVNFF